MQVWFNILNIAAINARVLYQEKHSISISRFDFIEKLVDDLYDLVKKPTTPVDQYTTPLKRNLSVNSPSPLSKRKFIVFDKENSPNSNKKTCQIRLCNSNSAINICISCNKALCGRCTEKKYIEFICKKCVINTN